MSVLAFLLVGIIAGWIGSLIMKGRGLGLLGDMIVGIIGAFIGAFVFRLFGVTTESFWGAVAMAAVGAIIFLFLVGMFGGSIGTPRPMGRT